MDRRALIDETILELLAAAPATVIQLGRALGLTDYPTRQRLNHLCEQGDIRYQRPVVHPGRRGRIGGEYVLASAPLATAGLFQSRDDGEYRKCDRCFRIGYGEESFHPATREFWPVVHDCLWFKQCLACQSELAAKVHGIVPDQVAA